MAKDLTESRRTRYTRLAMQDALVELLQDQPLGHHRQALCERADVNRSTFYAHYTSIEDLLHDIEDETMAWLLPRSTSCSRSLIQPASSTSSNVSANTSPTIASICRY